MKAPFVATEDRAYRDIVRQLERRTAGSLDEWAGLPMDVQEMARAISHAVKADGIWPSDVFFPCDPADIPFGLHFDFTDRWDLVPYALDLVEKRLGVRMPDEFWEQLIAMTFEEALTEICKRKAEQSHGADAGSAGG